MKLKKSCLVQDLSNPFQAARYHSLVIEKESCPNCLEIIAETEDGTIMAVQHRDIPHIQVKVESREGRGGTWLCTVSEALFC